MKDGPDYEVSEWVLFNIAAKTVFWGWVVTLGLALFFAALTDVLSRA